MGHTGGRSMFGLFGKRPTTPSAEELSKVTAAAVADVKAKWIDFVQTLHVKAGVPLAPQIDLFAPLVRRFYKNKYPILYHGPAMVFWEIIFTAIQESATHSVDEVNAAYEELRTQYELA